MIERLEDNILGPDPCGDPDTDDIEAQELASRPSIGDDGIAQFAASRQAKSRLTPCYTRTFGGMNVGGKWVSIPAPQYPHTSPGHDRRAG